MKSKLEIYALAVCFTAVICLVISGGIGGYAIVEIVSPNLTLASVQYQQLSDNDQYWRQHCFVGDRCKGEKPSDDELNEGRAKAMSIQIDSERMSGIQTLIKSIIFIISGGLALFIHWQIAKRARSA